MIIGVLSILIGLAFLLPGVIETITYWGDPLGMTIGIVGVITSLLMVLTGWAILQQWHYAKEMVIVTAGSWLIFSSIAGSLHFFGAPAILLGLGFPIAMVIMHLRADERAKKQINLP